jgi:ribosomal protein S18 acetylase RimI-like enzyme
VSVTIRLRAAQPTDSAAVTALVEAAYRHYVPRIGMRPGPMDADYEQVLREDDVTLAVDGIDLVGVLVLSQHDDAFWIENVAVTPAHRKLGVGKLLLRHAEDAARRAGFDAISLFTHEQMTENQELYRRIGYAEFERRGFRVFMRKQLDDAAAYG